MPTVIAIRQKKVNVFHNADKSITIDIESGEEQRAPKDSHKLLRDIMPTEIAIRQKKDRLTLDVDRRPSSGIIDDKASSKVNVFHNADKSITIDIESGEEQLAPKDSHERLRDIMPSVISICQKNVRMTPVSIHEFRVEPVSIHESRASFRASREKLKLHANGFPP
jgi:hypothetical protein